jgi:methionyl-tRNA synthetase
VLAEIGMNYQSNPNDAKTRKIFDTLVLGHADTKDFVEEWYQLVQLANEYITKAEPRKKYKENPEEAIADLEFLLWVIKQLGLLSAPLLVNGFAKLQKILGNDQISQINS